MLSTKVHKKVCETIDMEYFANKIEDFFIGWKSFLLSFMFIIASCFLNPTFELELKSVGKVEIIEYIVIFLFTWIPLGLSIIMVILGFEWKRPSLLLPIVILLMLFGCFFGVVTVYCIAIAPIIFGYASAASWICLGMAYLILSIKWIIYGALCNNLRLDFIDDLEDKASGTLV
ncbi:hypothetical protein M3Y97_01083000 [Aphelenchoides bicaudatus]|nr:hypothetical protein M3Y97_01083000 [Aphelenchoides bicaudatus]